MFKYLEKYGNKSLKAKSLSKVDLAIFSQIIYAPFEDIECDRYKGCTLGELNHELFQDGKPFGSWDWAHSILKLWQELPQYSRFASATLDNFYSNFQPEINEQFAAATFGYGKMAVIVFRGTDLSIVGWKEDFDMGYRAPLPCHLEAVEYINSEIPKYDKVYVVGQSKGGHLAVYAGACANDKKRIVKILSVEGPGIDKKTYSEHWHEIRNKTEILLPQMSMIGMTIGYGGNFSVVRAEAIGILQHDPFTWVVHDDHFATEKLSRLSKYLYTILHDFVEGTSDEERGVLINTIYRMVDSLGVDDVESLRRALLPNIREPINVLINLDDEEKEVLRKLRSKIHSDTRESFKMMMAITWFKITQKIKKIIEKLKEILFK